MQCCALLISCIYSAICPRKKTSPYLKVLESHHFSYFRINKVLKFRCTMQPLFLWFFFLTESSLAAGRRVYILLANYSQHQRVIKVFFCFYGITSSHHCACVLTGQGKIHCYFCLYWFSGSGQLVYAVVQQSFQLCDHSFRVPRIRHSIRLPY